MNPNDTGRGSKNGESHASQNSPDETSQRDTIVASSGDERQMMSEATAMEKALTENIENHEPQFNEKGDQSPEAAGLHGPPDPNPEGTAAERQISRSRSSAADNLSHLGSRMSTDPEGNTYPEGGLEAYLVVLGCFSGLFGSLGLVNTIGTFQAWIAEHQLKDYNDSAISWIFGVYAFLIFFGGLQIGPIFDARGPKYLNIVGSIMVLASMVIIGFCQEYWHFMLVYSVLGGIGVSLVFTPAVASNGHYFYRLRGRATGLAATGGSLGGVVYPLMLQPLLPKIGFAWATRAVTLICLVSLSIGCLLMKSRLPKKKPTKENMLPDIRIFMEPIFALTSIGIFFIEWGLFVPLTYISSHAIHHGVPRALSYQLLAILNVGSFFGRWIPGYTADYMGRFNTMILTVLLCLLSTACLWLPAGGNVAMIVSYAFIFGFASGSNISLTPVCVGQVCKTENYGRYYATTYTLVSFGTLTGTPIAGSILTLNGGEYWGLITFTSCCYFAGLVCFIAAKVLRHGWNPMIIF